MSVDVLFTCSQNVHILFTSCLTIEVFAGHLQLQLKIAVVWKLSARTQFSQAFLVGNSRSANLVPRLFSLLRERSLLGLVTCIHILGGGSA